MRVFKLLMIFLLAVLAIGAVYLRTRMNETLTREQLNAYVYETLTLPGGQVVNYRDEGNPNGPVVLMVHGAWATLSDYDKWVPVLAKHYRVVRLDMPGHGMTDAFKDRRKQIPAEWAKFVKAFVDAKGLNSFALIGHSYGGNASLRYVVSNPSSAKLLVLVAPGGAPTDDAVESLTEGEMSIMKMYNNPIGRYLVPRMISKDFLKDNYSILVNDMANFPDSFIDQSFDVMRYEKNLGAPIELAVNAMQGYDKNLTSVAGISIPTLLMWGEKDAVEPANGAEPLKAAIPSSEVIIYPNIGHMPMVENPEQSIADIVSFFKANGYE